MIRYESNIPKTIRRLKENERRALEAIGIFVRGEVQVRTPVDTGNLRNSYDYAVNLGANSVQIGTNVEYGPYVELGTRKMSAQPHLRPAIEENKERIRRLATEQLGRGLK